MHEDNLEEQRRQILAKLARPKLTSERAKLITEAYEAAKGEPAVIRRAKALEKILTSMSIYIQPHEVLVGNLGPEPISAPVYPEGGVDHILREIDSYEVRPGDKFAVSREVKADLQRVLPQWEGKTIKDLALSLMSDDVKQASESGLITFENMLISGVGHFVPDYERVLRCGTRGLKHLIAKKVSELQPQEPKDFQCGLFYEACRICCNAIEGFAARYVLMATNMADSEGDPQQRERLLEIAQTMTRVPVEPATSFREALQSVWFLHVILHIDSNGYGVTLGRMDQYLYPYFERDLKLGMSRNEAKALLIGFWLKCSDIVKLYSNKGARLYAGFPVTDPPTVGGLSPEGKDATNPLSELILEVEEAVRLPQPDVAVLWSERMQDAFLVRAARVVRSTNKPKFFNTHVGIEALVHAGVPKSEGKKDYTFTGCVESTVPGRTWGWSNAGSVNLAKCFELALNRGIDPLSGAAVGPYTPDARDIGTFDQLQDAFAYQVRHGVAQLVKALHAIEFAHRERWPEPLPSLLVASCLERGAGVEEGGADYNFTGIQGVGLATVADALTAIKTLVYERGTLTMSELLASLKGNFDNNETLRLRLENEVPKYGNDEDEADAQATWVYDLYCNEVDRYTNLRGGPFIAGTFSVSSHDALGEYVGATPDGRRGRTPLSDAHSPAQGRVRNGPTAVLHSVIKQDHSKAANGTLLNMRFNAHVLGTEDRLVQFAQLIKTFFKLGGFHVQFNITDYAALRDAQRHPECYPDLMVRVAAYVAPWIQLSRDLQEEILSRTELEIGRDA